MGQIYLADSSPNSVLKKLLSLWGKAVPDMYFSEALVRYLSVTPVRRGPPQDYILFTLMSQMRPGPSLCPVNASLNPLRAYHISCGHIFCA